jgi:hypothetical protein
MTDSLKFVPPKEDNSFPRYATYTKGEMKTHGTMSGAKNSLNNRMWTREVDPNEPEREGYNGVKRPNYRNVTRHAFLLESIEGEWFVLYEIKPGLTHNELPWMKEYFQSYKSWTPLTQSWKDSPYYGPKIASGEYPTAFRKTPMTTDEYVAWRIAVELERRGIKS